MVVGNVMKWERMGMGGEGMEDSGGDRGDSPTWDGGVYVFRVGEEWGGLGVCWVGDLVLTDYDGLLKEISHPHISTSHLT